MNASSDSFVPVRIECLEKERAHASSPFGEAE